MKNSTTLALSRGLVVSSLAVGLLTCNLALAGEKVERLLDTSQSPKLDIEHVNGKAAIRGWDKSQVQVSGELGDNTEEFIFEQRGNVVIIHVEVEHKGNKWWNNNDNGDDLIIYVPKGSDVNYTAVSADVEVNNITNSANVEVVNGDVVLTNVSERTKVESVNGDITIDNVTGKLHVETVNGDVEASHTGDQAVTFESVNGDMDVSTTSPAVSVESVNGGIALALQKIDSLDATTVNGQMEVSLFLNENGSVKASSVGGAMEFTFQPNVSAQFDIETFAGGHIINEITNDEVKKPKYGPSRSLRFIHNNGNANVDLSTVNGKILIKEN